MGVNMELEFDKYCKVGWSPRTVLPAPRLPTKVENKNRTENRCSRNDERNLLSLEEGGFTEIKFRNYRSVSCKNLPSGGDVEIEREKVLRRGSVYQNSRERKSRRAETDCGRKKIEFSLGSETSFSFSILDSICGSDEEAEVEPLEQKKSSVTPLDLKDSQSECGKSAEWDSMENQKFRCDQVSGPSSTGNVLKERDALALNKSLSAKPVLPHSPSHSEGKSSNRSSKSRFTPIKKILDPLTRAKSHRKTSDASRSSSSAGTGRTKLPTKSVLHDFSGEATNVDYTTQKKDQLPDVCLCLPAHLNGNLKMEQKHGVPYFEFSMVHSGDVLVAKTWKEEDSLSWAYTFHHIQVKKISNVTPRGIKYSNKDSPLVGQMQVSCFLSSEQRDGGAFGNSMVAEFVVYDIAHARKSASGKEEIGRPEASKVSGLEIAAVVVQVPFKETEGLKYKRGDRLSHYVHSDLLDLSSVGQGTRSKLDDHNSSVKVNVMAPLGNHGLPISVESRGPLPLLKRWRLGGGCDCGGWDMACPLLVFGNHVTQSILQHSLLEKDQPLKLYVQGGKESMPALTIAITGKGQYSVDFHAQLSTLQAFAVCVAILHTMEASSSLELQQQVQSASLKAPVEDVVKVLVKEAVTEEEREKATKVAEENPPSFRINPPFSPIARV